jgi:FRG domain
MAQLPVYSNLDDKRTVFNKSGNFIINTVSEFDHWYNQITFLRNEATKNYRLSDEDEESIYIHYPYIFRGVGDAKYKIFASAQRHWLINNMNQWAKKDYLEFVQDLLDTASKLPLLDKVFKYYKLVARQRDFPIMSILQHYGAPTPLIDWTYNIDVSLYFATEYCTPISSANEIEKYFSVYLIDRSNQNSIDFLNIFKFHQGSYPLLKSFNNIQNEPSSIFYLSDFEKRIPRKSTSGFKDQRPLTILFNQRIIPQEGLFIFNPSSYIPLEDCFNVTAKNHNNNSNKMLCVNIHKDLSDYIRRKIKLVDIEKGFIYPDLEKNAEQIKETVLYDLVK